MCPYESDDANKTERSQTISIFTFHINNPKHFLLTHENSTADKLTLTKHNLLQILLCIHNLETCNTLLRKWGKGAKIKHHQSGNDFGNTNYFLIYD
jgi:hypothetical protein